MANVNNDELAKSLRCAFCATVLPSTEAMQEHLHMCGNKTEQCPNCRRFIRRAIFAYHYENNCANLDEIVNDAPSTHEQSKPVSTHPPLELQTEGASPKNNDKETIHRSTDNVLLRSPSRDKPAESFQTGIVCPDCREEYCMDERDTHRYFCRVKSTVAIHEEFGGSPGNSWESYGNTVPAALASVALNVDKSHPTDHVPCEICDEPIELQNYNNHTMYCAKREQDRPLKQGGGYRTEPSGYEDVQNLQTTFQTPGSVQGSFNQVHTTTVETQYYIATFRLPPLVSLSDYPDECYTITSHRS